jgi:hypothetical protein
MRVKILHQTSWKHGQLRPGDVLDVTDDVGIRWVTNRIAEDVPPVEEDPIKVSTNDQIRAKRTARSRKPKD